MVQSSNLPDASEDKCTPPPPYHPVALLYSMVLLVKVEVEFDKYKLRRAQISGAWCPCMAMAGCSPSAHSSSAVADDNVLE